MVYKFPGFCGYASDPQKLINQTHVANPTEHRHVFH